jgi:hypothetical protein
LRDAIGGISSSIIGTGAFLSTGPPVIIPTCPHPEKMSESKIVFIRKE